MLAFIFESYVKDNLHPDLWFLCDQCLRCLLTVSVSFSSSLKIKGKLLVMPVDTIWNMYSVTQRRHNPHWIEFFYIYIKFQIVRDGSNMLEDLTMTLIKHNL
jgi:hypothetical protein